MNEVKKSTLVVWPAAAGKPIVSKAFVGRWRITELEGFDSKYLDLCGQAKIEISEQGIGEFAFGAVQAEIDGRMDEMAVGVFSFSFEGEDEGDLFFGRGYCTIKSERLIGRLYRHFGDTFTFSGHRVRKSGKF
jgi:hypothetical protein